MDTFKTIPLPASDPFDDAQRLVRARDFADELARRRTVRDYASDAVPRELIEACLRAAGTAPSGANQQPWRFVAVQDAGIKQRIREAAEAEEREFYQHRATDEWLQALAPWLIGVFYERFGVDADGHKSRRYYPHESVGIATGMLITALHHAGLATLTHTPSPMGFLNQILQRPKNEMPYMLLVVGHPVRDCRVPDIQRMPLADYATFL